MNITGKTSITIGDRLTRVLSHQFNIAVKKSTTDKLDIHDADGNLIVPSKGLTWAEVGVMVRAGKKVQARVEKTA